MGISKKTKPVAPSEDSTKVVNNLFLKKTETTEKKKESQLEGSTGSKGFKQKVNEFSAIGKDVLEQTKEFGKGVIATLKDATQSIKVRQGLEDKAELQVESVDFSNRHTDAITGILNKTFSGNLFDAGVSTLNLFNQGTKIDVAKTPDIDRNVYRFKYLYSKNGNTDDTIDNSQEGPNFVNFLDSIEDPTILGFSLKIDKESSPLFSGIKQVSDNNTPPTTLTSVEKNSAYNFIKKYKSVYSEMQYCTDYLKEFTDSISKIFSSPSTDESYLSAKLKNYYIQSIKNLNKLDERFVNTTENNEEVLEFELSEDVRLYTTRMVMLYKNLTWSYNAGKKLIPENLLRFNLYIKISEKRNFTTSATGDTYSNLRDGYSRIIYELKDCEFLFNESSILSSDMSMISQDDPYAKLTIKMKYRKVNRIFYSKYYDGENIIGDKFFTPNINKSKTDLENSKFIPNSDAKSKAVSNNIPVAESLSSKLNNLKTKGLLKNTDKDNAVSRFGKSIGNKAIKTGATLLDDKVQQIKNDINKSTSFVNNNITGFLKGNIFSKTKELGVIDKTDNSETFNVKTDPAKNNTNIIEVFDIKTDPLRDNTTILSIHQTVDNKNDVVNEKIHKFHNVNEPTEYLDNTTIKNNHQTIDNKKDVVNEKIHKFHNVNNPNEYIDMITRPIPNMEEEKLDNGNKIVSDMTNNYLNIGKKDGIKDPISIIPISDKPIIIEEEYLNNGDKSIIKNPDNIVPNIDSTILEPNETINHDVKNNIIMDESNINNSINSSIKVPIQSQSQTDIPSSNNTIKEPISSDITDIKHDIEEPNSIPIISTNIIDEPIQIVESSNNTQILDPIQHISEILISKINPPLENVHIIKNVDTLENLGTIDIKNISLDKQDNLGSIEDFKKKWVIKNPPNNPNLKC